MPILKSPRDDLAAELAKLDAAFNRVCGAPTPDRWMRGLMSFEGLRDSVEAASEHQLRFGGDR